MVEKLKEENKGKKLVVYIISDKKCIPCRRLLLFLKELGYNSNDIQIKDARKHKKELLWITGGRSVVPVILGSKTGKIMIGCPVDFKEFTSEFKHVISE